MNNCWTIRNCDKQKCPAYGNEDQKCWLVPNTQCHGSNEATFIQKMELCLDCDAFAPTTDMATVQETLDAVKSQFRAFRSAFEQRNDMLEQISLEIAIGLSEVCDGLGRIANGDPDVRISEGSDIELLSRLKASVNSMAEKLAERIEQSHEMAISLAEHFDVLHRVTAGDMGARINGDPNDELLKALKQTTNEAIQTLSLREQELIATNEQLQIRESEVMRSRQSLETIMKGLPVGLIVVSKEKTILQANPAALAMIGCAVEEEIVGRRCHDAFCPALKDSCPVLDMGQTVDNAERLLISKDRQEIPILKTVVPIQLDGEEVLLEAFVDIRLQKDAEAERHRLHEELVDASRLAGMAEVATGVLHNVGNVLNSVNISAQVVSEKIQKSRVGGLVKANALIDQHADDLGTFITKDERGRHLPDYLRQLSDQLLGEREFVLEELETLTRSVEHIKEIVSMQQSYASTGGLSMMISLSDAVEDALKTNDATLLRHDIELVREYGDPIQVTTDKHKVLQILVNLVSNAKQALSASDSEPKRLTIRIGRSGEEFAIVEVEDNGVGIPRENQARVFEHGFTTKENGHGFGLHSSALAAQELGGKLTVCSDGPGRGARFTLAIPLDSPGLNCQKPTAGGSQVATSGQAAAISCP